MPLVDETGAEPGVLRRFRRCIVATLVALMQQDTARARSAWLLRIARTRRPHPPQEEPARLAYERNPPRGNAGVPETFGSYAPVHTLEHPRPAPEPPRDTLPPGLVIGTGITALAVVRSLGRAGAPVVVLTADPGLPRQSRWYHPPPGEPLRDLADLEAYLEGLPFEHGVLIPAADDAAAAVSGLSPEIRRRFPSCQADRPVLLDLMDKAGLARILEAHGVPHPKTIAVRSLEDVDAVDALGIERAFIKPRDSQEFHRRLGLKAIRPADREDLLVQLRRVAREGLSVVVQEYIPGPPTASYFVDGFIDRRGRVCGRLVRQRLRMWPPEFGNSCATRSVPLSEAAEAVDDLERLLAALSYRGPYDAEFKRDPDGVFRLVEINVRPWWQIEFSAQCGIDIVQMIYRDALGLPVERQLDYEVGRQWLYCYFDVQACARMVRTGEAGLLECLSSWAKARWAAFGWDDPMPGISTSASILWKALRRRTLDRDKR